MNTREEKETHAEWTTVQSNRKKTKPRATMDQHNEHTAVQSNYLNKCMTHPSVCVDNLLRRGRKRGRRDKKSEIIFTFNDVTIRTYLTVLDANLT
jgi:hypothetical protein